MKKISIGSAVAIFTLILDQFSKMAVVKYFTINLIDIKVTSFFNLVLVYNKGISFGLFNKIDYSNYIFATISLVIVVLLFNWLKKSNKLGEIIALGLVIGGAIGNVVDRVLYQGVVDFLQFHLYGYYWPSFNIADSAIFIGVCILMFFSVDSKSKNSKIIKNKE